MEVPDPHPIVYTDEEFHKSLTKEDRIGYQAVYNGLARDWSGRLKDTVRKMVFILLKLSHPPEDICRKLGEDLEGVSDSYIRRILPDEYKHTDQQRFKEPNQEVESHERPIPEREAREKSVSIEDEHGNTFTVKLLTYSSLDLCPHCKERVLIARKGDGLGLYLPQVSPR